VNAPALHADEAVLDHVHAAYAVAAADLVQLFDDFDGAQPPAVDAHGRARLEADRDRLDLVGRLPRRNGHAEIDQLDAVDREVFELAGLVADVQAVFVGAIGLGDRGLDRNLPLFA